MNQDLPIYGIRWARPSAVGTFTVTAIASCSLQWLNPFLPPESTSGFLLSHLAQHLLSGDILIFA